LLAAVAPERGHFRYESGDHGDLWLDLDRLLIDAGRTRALASALAERAVACRPDVVCGPLTGGAFVAQFVAAEIGAGFVFAERIVAGEEVRYRIPGPLRQAVRDRRVLLVDDAVNAGSALLATWRDVLACGAQPAGSACLLALGDAPTRIAAATGAPLHHLLALEHALWSPETCPLCAGGTPFGPAQSR
jgi:orotate phosphoribosyltransferase